MMKVFCDGCGRELPPGQRLVGVGHDCNGQRPAVVPRDSFTEIRSSNEKMPAVQVAIVTPGDWCKYCVLETVETWDDRPTAEVDTVSALEPQLSLQLARLEWLTPLVLTEIVTATRDRRARLLRLAFQRGLEGFEALDNAMGQERIDDAIGDSKRVFAP